MGEMADLMKEIVEYNTTKLVDKPESVDISASTSTKAVIIQIKVDKFDCGKVIGKRGRTIESLKVICLGIKNTNFPDDSRRVIIEVLEDENSSFSYN
jgi:predicted RNA-binding protein YlqC (UPF0109 family)